MIDDYQTGFIVDRNILEGVATSQEIIHQRKKSKSNGFLLKLDFKKAYDIVDWECLQDTLRLGGFGNKRIAWVENWL